MNASTFRRRVSLFFAALSITPLLASGAPVSMDFKVLIDADNREATGCTVITTAGLVKGVDQVLTTSVSYDSAAGTAAVTGVTRQTCTDSVANTFSSAIPVDTTGWPVGVGAGGNLFIETHIPTSALGAVTNMHLAFTAASTTLADAVVLDPDGETIIWPPLPGHRRHAAGLATTRVITLDGVDTDWNGIEPIAGGSSDASPRLRFLSLRTYMNDSNLFFAISAQSNANAPTANDDSYSVERGKSLGIGVPGVLSNDTDPNHKPLTAILVGTGTHHGTLTLNADGSFSYQNDGSSAPSDSFDYKANNGSADSNTAHVDIAITEPNPGPPPVKPAFTSANNTRFTVGTQKTFNITTTPVVPFVTVTKQSGTLPNGLNFTATPNSGTGQISGTAAPGTGGTYALVFRATNAVGFTDQPFTLTVCNIINVGNPATTTATAGVPFSQTFTQTGVVGTATFSTASPLPSGLTLSNAGVLSGTPAVTGTFPITVTVTDSQGCSGTGTPYNLVVGCPAITVNPASLPNATQNTAYSQQLTATGDPGPFNFAVTSGALPSGLTLSSSGLLSGTPTASGVFNFTVTATTAGTYACSGSRAYTLNVCVTPSVSIVASATTICTGTNVTFTATPVNGGTTPSYQWKVNGANVGSNSNTFSSTTLANGDQVVVVMTSNAAPCVTGNPATSNTITMTVNAIPATPAAANGGPYCQGATIALSTPAVAGATYSWTGPNGFTSAQQNPTIPNAPTADAGTYSVTVTVNGCTSAAGTTNVVVNPTPATPTASNGGPYCQGSTIALSTPAVAGASYAWTGPNGFTSTLQNPTIANATPANGGTYSVTITVSGCPSAAGTTSVVVNATPATPSASNGGPYCVGATIALSTPAVAGASYSWTGPNGFTSTLQNPTISNATTANAGTYSVTVAVNGCPSAAGSTSVAVNPIPATPAASNGGPYCEGATIALSTPAVAGASYAWTGPNGFTSTLQNPTITNATVANGGSYSVTITVSGCPSAPGSTSVVVNPTPATPTATNGGPYCEGSTIALSTPTVSGASYAWTGPSGFTSALQNPTIPSATTANAGTYSVIITVNGCPSAAGTTDVVVNTIPATPTASNGGPYCVGSTIALSTPTVSGATYSWTGPNGFTSAQQNPTIASAALANGGTYSVTVTVNGCTSAAGTTSVVVNANPSTPTITPSGPTTFCAGGSVTLTAPGGFTYSWSTGATTQSILVTAAGSYSVTVTDANGCSAASAPTVVTVNPNPATPTITPGGPTTFCAGGSVTLTAPNGFTYLWSTTETTQSIVVSASGSYTVTVTDGNGCQATSAPTVVTVNPNPATPAITPSGPTTFCAGGSVTLTAPNGFTYLWSTNETTQSIAVSTSGSYTVTVTDGNGCQATSAPTVVTVNPNPATPTITPSGSTTFCNGGSVTLTAPAGFTYLWSTSATTQSIVVSTAGSYTVTVTDGNGCQATSAPTVVTVNANPATPTITPSGPTTFCAGGSVTLTAPAGFTYLWSTSATTQSIVVSTSGSYTVTVTDGNGCQATSAPTTVTVHPNPATPTITPSGATTFCAGSSVTLTAPGGFTYSWSTGATTQSIIVTTSGSYTVTVTDGNGCQATSAPTAVTVHPNPATPTITPASPSTCANSTGNTASGPGGFTYFWSITNGSITGGQTSQTVTYTAGASGSVGLTLTVTDGNGCSSSNGASITINPNPAAPTITPTPSSVCSGSTGNTASGPGGFTYFWSIVNGTITSGQTSQTVTYTAGSTGTVDLTLVVTDGNGCSASNGTSVTIVQAPAAPTITPSASGVCAGSTGNTADGPAGATTYSWGITNGTITSATNIQTITWTAGTAGTTTLSLTVTNANGCSATNSTDVVVNANPSAPTITPSSTSVCPSSTGNTASGPASMASYSWSITNGTITSGQTAQTVTYTAAATGPVGLTLTVTNAAGCSATNSASVSVVSFNIQRTGGGSFPAATFGVGYPAGNTFTANCTGCTGTIHWAFQSGAQPPGINLTIVAGSLSGIPSATGQFTMIVTATDTGTGCSGSASFPFTILPDVGVSTPTNATGQSYSNLVNNTQAYVTGGSTATPATAAVPLSGTIVSGDKPASGVTVDASSVGTFATNAGGSVTIAADGTFLYTPPLSNISSDFFNYTATSNTGTVPSLPQYAASTGAATNTGKITLNLVNRVWYVKNNVTNGNGQSQSPFNSLSNFTNAARVSPDAANDYIFIYTGDGTTTNQTTGIKLLSGEQLIGQGVALVVNSQTLLAAGTKPQITNSAGDGITLNNGNTIAGLTVTGTSANGINGTNTNGLTIDSVTATSAGAGASALVLTTPSNNVTITNTTLSNSPLCLTLNGGTANFAMNNTNTITANAGQRSINFANLGATSITNVGASITDNGVGMAVSNSVNGAVINFTGTQTLNTGASNAVTLSTNGATSVISFSGTLNIGNTTPVTGTGFSAGTGTLNVSGTANITTGAAPTALSLSGITVGASGVTFNSVNATGPTTGISVANTTNATAVVVNGGTITGAGTGVFMQGSSTNLTLSNVTITGGTTGITNTTNFGTLTGNTLAVSAVTALNLTSGTLAGSWGNVSSSGGTNGVSLNGVSGSFSTAGGTLTGATGSTFKVVGGASGTIGWGGVINQANGALAVDISGSNAQTINFSGNVTTSGTSTGLSFTGSTGTYNFTGAASTITGSGGGISIGSGEGGTISFGSGYSINGPTTAAITVSGSPSVVSTAINYSGTITHNATGNIFNVNGLSGSLLVNGTSAAGTFNGNGSVTSAFSNVTGTVTINHLSETSGFNTATGTGVAITGTNTGSVFTFNNLVINASGSTDTMKGLTMSGGGTLAITATGGNSSITVGSSALDLNGITLNASALQTVTSAGRGTTAGIILTNVTGGGALSISGGTLTGLANTGTFVASGGTPNVTYSGSITQNAANKAVDVQGLTGGGVTINSVTCGASATGIHIGDTTQVNAPVSFTTLTLGTSVARMTNQAVTIVNGNSTYSLGTVSIFTSGAKGISLTSASTANTLNITTGTVDATTANAITVTGASSATRTTLGVSLTKVSSTSATGNGITLTNTNGSFTIAGDGGAANNGSGGTISASSAEGILINTAGTISLGYLNVQNSGTSGISVTGSTGFTLNRSNVTDNAGGASDEGVNLINNTGTITFTNDVVDSAPNNQVNIDNFNTNLTAINASNSTFKCTAGNACQPSGSVGANGMLVQIRGTSVLTSANVQSCTFSGVRSTGLQVSATDSATIGSSSGGVITAPAASHSFVVQSCTVQNNNAGLDFDHSQTANITFQILNNTTITGQRAAAINSFCTAAAGTSGTVTGYISGNQIGTQGTKDSGSAIGNGIRLIVQGDSVQGFFTVDGNTIREVANAHTIELFSQNGRGVSGTGSARFKITNNTLPQPSGTNQSIGCGAGVPCMPDGPLFSLADEHNSTCLLITGNSIYDATTMNAASDIYLATRTGPPTGATTTIQTGSNGGNSAAAITFINANNTLTGANKTFDEEGTITTVASCGSFPP